MLDFEQCPSFEDVSKKFHFQAQTSTPFKFQEKGTISESYELPVMKSLPSDSKHNVFFSGGTITDIKWCPNMLESNQWLAVSCHTDTAGGLHPIHASNSSISGFIQLWLFCVGDKESPASSPQLAYALDCEDFGFPVKMQWCPARSMLSSQHLGLLAVLHHGGAVCVYSLPTSTALQARLPSTSAPLLRLSPAYVYHPPQRCLCIAWSHHPSPLLLIGIETDGFVVVDFGFVKPKDTEASKFPLLQFFTSCGKGCRAAAWHPTALNHFAIVSTHALSSTSDFSIRDFASPHLPLIQLSSVFADCRALVWVGNSAVAATENGVISVNAVDNFRLKLNASSSIFHSQVLSMSCLNSELFALCHESDVYVLPGLHLFSLYNRKLQSSLRVLVKAARLSCAIGGGAEQDGATKENPPQESLVLSAVPDMIFVVPSHLVARENGTLKLNPTISPTSTPYPHPHTIPYAVDFNPNPGFGHLLAIGFGVGLVRIAPVNPYPIIDAAPHVSRLPAALLQPLSHSLNHLAEDDVQSSHQKRSSAEPTTGLTHLPLPLRTCTLLSQNDTSSEPTAFLPPTTIGATTPFSTPPVTSYPRESNDLNSVKKRRISGRAQACRKKAKKEEEEEDGNEKEESLMREDEEAFSSDVSEPPSATGPRRRSTRLVARKSLAESDSDEFEAALEDFCADGVQTTPKRAPAMSTRETEEEQENEEEESDEDGLVVKGIHPSMAKRSKPSEKPKKATNAQKKQHNKN